MSEYAFAVFAVCLIGGVALMLSYGSGRAEGIAVGIITLAVIISPIADMLSDFDIEEWLDSIKAESEEIEGEYGYVIEDAFAEGINRAVAEKFSLERGDIRVRLVNFDSGEMSCEHITVTLSGAATLADYKAVEKYLNSLNLGECDVQIEIK